MIEVQVLFLREEGASSYKEISASLNISVYHVKKILAACSSAGMTFDIAKDMTEEELSKVLYPDDKKKSVIIVVVDCERWYLRYKSMDHPNMLYIWTNEYVPECLSANYRMLSYGQFCRRINAWTDENRMKIVMPIDRKPGEKLFIDWMGDTYELPSGPTEPPVIVYFFITTLGDSSYPFVEGFLNMKQESWIQGHIDAFMYYGGLPRKLVPDNCKTAVIRRQCYDINFNHAYLQMAYHYKVAITPARVREPQDKGSVEAGVKWLETWLLESLKKLNCTDLESLNKAIRVELAKLCKKKFQKRAGTREEVFETVDKPALRPLPKDPFVFFETFADKTVGPDYHVECDGFYYSVPYRYAHSKVDIHLYPKKVEIYQKGKGMIALHPRRFQGDLHVTIREHMPVNHQKMADFESRDGNYYRNEAANLGEQVAEVVEIFLSEGPSEEHGYRNCNILMDLAQKYGRISLNSACRTVLSIDKVSVTNIRNFLKNLSDDGPGKEGTDKPPLTDVEEYGSMEHENLRKDWE